MGKNYSLMLKKNTFCSPLNPSPSLTVEPSPFFLPPLPFLSESALTAKTSLFPFQYCFYFIIFKKR